MHHQNPTAAHHKRPGPLLLNNMVPLDVAMNYQSINQSINQSNFYSANIPGEARLSDATAKSLLNSKIEETVP